MCQGQANEGHKRNAPYQPTIIRRILFNATNKKRIQPAFREMKQAGRELFVIINACVASYNVDEVDATIKGLSA